MCIRDSSHTSLDCGVQQGYLLSFLNLCVDDVIHNWKMKFPEHFMIGKSAEDTLLFADDQVIL